MLLNNRASSSPSNFFDTNDYTDEISGIAVNDLIREYGSPLFVLSEKRLRDNIRQLTHAFASRYQPIIHAWSYKTNYLNAVCATLHQEGSWAEVVSAFEYQKARALGVPAARILFNGPHKNRAILERAVAEGARVHLDNLDELFLLEAIAKALNIVTAVTLRLNFDTGYTENWSRFGFSLDSGAAFDAVMKISNSSHLILRGLHSHIGTFVLEPKAYQVQVEKMCAFIEIIEQKTAVVIDSLDIGGGFPSENTPLHPPSARTVASIADYAELICTTLKQKTAKRQAQGKPPLTLILETGRAVIDDAQVLLSSVVSRKRLADGRASYSLDAGINLLFTAALYQHHIKPTRVLAGSAEETVLYGCLCMNTDVIRHAIYLPPLSVGDSLIISPVGAYNNTLWMQFIEYRPNIVMVHENQTVSVVRKAENLTEMNRLECLPAHLAGKFNF